MFPLSPVRVLPRWMVVCGITVSLIFFSSQVPAFDSFTTTVSFYDGVNLSTGATEVDPTVLTLVIGSAQEVERIAAPEIDPLFDFSPSVHISFGLAANPAQPVMLQPQADVAFAIVEQADPASLNETQLSALYYAPQPVAVAPHQFVVAKLGDGIYRILGQIAPNPNATVQFTVWTPEVGSVPTVTPTPPVSEPTVTPTPPVSVPEPGSVGLVTLGVLLFGGWRYWNKRLAKGGKSMKYPHIFLIVAVLLLSGTLSVSAANVIIIRVGTGEGTVEGGDEIFCGSSCEATYEKGTVVQLKAIPDDEETRFDGWLVNGKPHQGTLVIEEENILVTAKFTSTLQPANDLKVSWYNKNDKRSATMALDEIAIFPAKRPDDPYTLEGEYLAATEEVAKLFHADAEVSSWGDFCVILKSPEPVPKDQLVGIFETIRSHPYIREAGPVLYANDTRTPDAQMIPTGEIVIHFPEWYSDDQIQALQETYGLHLVMTSDSDLFSKVYRVATPLESVTIANAIYESGLVEFAAPEMLMSSVFYLNELREEESIGDHWHFQTVSQNGADIWGAWALQDKSKRPIRGSGIAIAILDNGVEINHPDLTENVNRELSFDFIDSYSWENTVKDKDPTPPFNLKTLNLPPDISYEDFITWDGGHGTLVAGVAAGRGENGKGIYGVAPDAQIIGYRLAGFKLDKNNQRIWPVFRNIFPEEEALRQNRDKIRVYNNSRGVLPGHLGELWGDIDEELKNGAEAGNMVVVSAGNERKQKGNTNYNKEGNSRYTFAVAASTKDGTYALYSNPGANLLVNVPCNGIPSTDRMGENGMNPWWNTDHRDYTDVDYTKTFSGTSAAAPVLSGVIALMLQAETTLNWRDVQRILIKTAEKNPGVNWENLKNAAGYSHSYDYGFGRVNAKKAVETALTWKQNSLPDEIKMPIIGSNTKKVKIPPKKEEIIEIKIKKNINIEFVEVYIDVQHSHWCNLEVELVAPSQHNTNMGDVPTTSILSTTNSCFTDEMNESEKYGFKKWRFGSVRHFGESSQGIWKLVIRNMDEYNEAKFKSVELKIYGTKFPPGLPFTGVYGMKNTMPLDWRPKTLPTRDDGYVLLAATFEGPLLLKLDSAGGIEWAKALSGGGLEHIERVGTFRATEAALTAFSQAGFSNAAAALRIALGSKTYASPSLFTHLARRAVLPFGEEALAALPVFLHRACTETGWVLAGTTSLFSASKGMAWVVKLDTTGKIVWQFAYDVWHDSRTGADWRRRVCCCGSALCAAIRDTGICRQNRRRRRPLRAARGVLL